MRLCATEMKTAAGGTTGCLLTMEIMRGKLPVKHKGFHNLYGHCSGLVLRMTEQVNDYGITYNCSTIDVI